MILKTLSLWHQRTRKGRGRGWKHAKKEKIPHCNGKLVAVAGQRGNTECPLSLQQWLQAFHHMLKVEKADLRSSESSILVLCFLPETTAVSCSNHPKSLQRELCGAAITFPGWESSFPPAPRLTKHLNHSIIAQQWSLTLVKQFVLIM